MSKRLLFIVNPRSGKGQIKEHLADILDIMIKAGYQVSVHITQAGGDATQQTIEQAKDYDRIICSGGDGTLDRHDAASAGGEEAYRIYSCRFH